jgi:tRNA(Ile)-lysidine synthase
MIRMAGTDASPPASDAAFLDVVAAGLPPRGFFTGPAVVAVSGGADSVALLLALNALAVRHSARPRLVVAHARHDLRAEAAGDAEFVRGVAARLGLPCVVRDLPVRAADGSRGEGVESRARRRRLEFLAEAAGEHGARHVAVAHTADDQAETILHRILRGTGPAGLRGMAAARALCDGVALVRPLLAVPRSAVREYLASCGEPWCEDATNADVRYARNFLRHDVLPRCEAGPYPAASAALVRLGGQAAGLAAAIRSAADHMVDTVMQRRGDGAIVVRTDALASLDRQFIAEVFVALWSRQGWPQRDMTARHYAALAGLAADSLGPGPAAVDLPGGVRVAGAGRGLLLVTPPVVGR